MTTKCYEGDTRDALCFCEYDNNDGQRSHILAMCCDCEALDHVCDRFLTCNAVSNEATDRLCATVEDRCRIPWPGGAVRIRLDVLLPLILMPCAVLLATNGPYWTVAAVFGTLAALVIFFRIWGRRVGRTRTRAFFVFAMTSIVQMYLTYVVVVVGFREVLLWETLLLSTMFFVLLLLVFRARRDPGAVPTDSEVYGKTGAAEQQGSRTRRQSSSLDDQVALSEYEVTWVDSRPIKSGRLVTRCEVCHLAQPPRAAHCMICGICVRGRDHHCLWIDTCVGANNHREFFFVLLTFVLTGFYGAHLTMTTVCTPEMYLDWFLWPADCRFLYVDFPTALSFVSACFTYIGVAFMSLVLVQQLVLISQNVTQVELRRASARGWARYRWFPLLVPRAHNVNDRGFGHNWRDFLNGSRRQRYVHPTVPV